MNESLTTLILAHYEAFDKMAESILLSPQPVAILATGGLWRCDPRLFKDAAVDSRKIMLQLIPCEKTTFTATILKRRREPTHYEILQISEDASLLEIKSAYQRLIRQSHPDNGGLPDQFSQILKAYRTLINSENKRIYDSTLPFKKIVDDIADTTADLMKVLPNIIKIVNEEKVKILQDTTRRVGWSAGACVSMSAIAVMAAFLQPDNLLPVGFSIIALFFAVHLLYEAFHLLADQQKESKNIKEDLLMVKEIAMFYQQERALVEMLTPRLTYRS